MTEQSKNKQSRLSIIIIIGLVVVSAIAMVGIYLFTAPAEESTREVVVFDGDGGEHRFSMSEDGTYPITTSFGTNVVEIKDNTVHVSEADCPNQTCVETGTISRAGETIICLPHELVVTIEDSSGDKADIDSIAS